MLARDVRRLFDVDDLAGEITERVPLAGQQVEGTAIDRGINAERADDGQFLEDHGIRVEARGFARVPDAGQDEAPALGRHTDPLAQSRRGVRGHVDDDGDALTIAEFTGGLNRVVDGDVNTDVGPERQRSI